MFDERVSLGTSTDGGSQKESFLRGTPSIVFNCKKFDELMLDLMEKFALRYPVNARAARKSALSVVPPILWENIGPEMLKIVINALDSNDWPESNLVPDRFPQTSQRVKTKVSDQHYETSFTNHPREDSTLGSLSLQEPQLLSTHSITTPSDSSPPPSSAFVAPHVKDARHGPKSNEAIQQATCP